MWLAYGTLQELDDGLREGQFLGLAQHVVGG